MSPEGKSIANGVLNAVGLSTLFYVALWALVGAIW